MALALLWCDVPLALGSIIILNLQIKKNFFFFLVMPRRIPQPGIEPAVTAMEHQVLTTAPPGNSLS